MSGIICLNYIKYTATNTAQISIVNFDLKSSVEAFMETWVPFDAQ